MDPRDTARAKRAARELATLTGNDVTAVSAPGRAPDPWELRLPGEVARDDEVALVYHVEDGRVERR